MTRKPIVSVVIPTYERPLLVERAVKSALGQTLRDIEVIVVTDGPETITQAALSKINDSRLRIVSLHSHQGANAARNRGIAEAQGEWSAFLDDDDEWLPTKLQEQLAVACNTKAEYPIISCFILARETSKESVRADRLPGPREMLSEFLCVDNPFRPRGIITTSTVLAKKKLFEKVAFSNNLSQLQDLDWVLRAAATPGVKVEFVPRILLIWHVEEERKRIGNATNWRGMLSWIRERRSLVTPRAYAGIILGTIAYRAKISGDKNGFFLLLREAVLFGNPSFIILAGFFYKWFIPEGLRKQIKLLMEGQR